MVRTIAWLVVVGLVGVARGAVAAYDQPDIFAPGVLSGPGNDNCPSFTPNGNTVYYDAGSMILVSHRIGGSWSKPQIASFSGTWGDHDPAMAPDGSYIIYASNKPISGDKALDLTAKGKTYIGSGNNLWRVDRLGQGWSEPKHLPATVNANTRTYAPSIATDGTLYFTSHDENGVSHLYRSRYRDGAYQPLEKLQIGAAGAEEQDPAIAPDQSFIVFSGDAQGKTGMNDFFIAFRTDHGWTAPIDMGDAVNSKTGKWNQWGSHLSPDHRTLFYTSDRGASPTYPRTPQEAKQQLTRVLSWDNGGNHVWSISLAPWLDEKDGKRRS